MVRSPVAIPVAIFSARVTAPEGGTGPCLAHARRRPVPVSPGRREGWERKAAAPQHCQNAGPSGQQCRAAPARFLLRFAGPAARFPCSHHDRRDSRDGQRVSVSSASEYPHPVGEEPARDQVEALGIPAPHETAGEPQPACRGGYASSAIAGPLNSPVAASVRRQDPRCSRSTGRPRNS
jgi:hypothetical protein